MLTMKQAVPVVEKAFKAHGLKETLMPPKIYLPLPEFDGDFRAMPAYFDGAAGIKWVNAHPKNPTRHGLPSVLATYILNDPETAVPLAIMDATLLTAVRTGAAGAVAAKYLAHPTPQVVGFVGCGVQAHTLHDALRVVFPNFEVQAFDLNDKAAKTFAEKAGGKCATLEQTAGSDIVCTATPSRSPLLRRAWIQDGAHINAMGADAPGKQELDPQILLDAKLVIDELHQATSSGEINKPFSEGTITPAAIHADLGEIVAGLKPGREGNEISVFDSTGLAIQDVALAKLIYEQAESQDIGQCIAL